MAAPGLDSETAAEPEWRSMDEEDHRQVRICRFNLTEGKGRRKNIMNRDGIVAELFRLQDRDYAILQAKILPTVSSDRIIGVRTPALRLFAKNLCKDPDLNEKNRQCMPVSAHSGDCGFRTAVLLLLPRSLHW